MLLSFALAALAQTSIEDHLATDVAFRFSDGSSVYTLHRDHRFELAPVGMSGRQVDGVWSRVDGGILVTGRWTWLNGASRADDAREMLIAVVPHGGPPETLGLRQVEVQNVYFTVERLQPVAVSVLEERVKAIGKE